MSIRAFVQSIFLGLVVSACADAGEVTDEAQDVRPDVVQCEEAAAHIHECCPGATSLPDCHYVTAACIALFGERGTEYPVELPLSEADSQQYRAESCADLVASGTCAMPWPVTAYPVPPQVEDDCGN